MPSSSVSEIRRFYRVARERQEDARILLDQDRTTGAFYLAGYAVECGLKALLLHSLPRSQHAAMVRAFYGKIGHDIEWLWRRLQRRGVATPPEITRLVRRGGRWSTGLRYEPGRRDRRLTQAYLDTVAQILRWAEGRL